MMNEFDLPINIIQKKEEEKLKFWLFQVKSIYVSVASMNVNKMRADILINECLDLLISYLSESERDEHIHLSYNIFN